MQSPNSGGPRLWNTPPKLAAMCVAVGCLILLAVGQFTGDSNPSDWPSWKAPVMIGLLVVAVGALIVWKRLNRP